MKKWFLIIVFFFSLSEIRSFPISPVPLRELILKSELIIIGYVNIKHIKYSDSAYVKIIEILKGKYGNTVISFLVDDELICPQPPSFKDSTYVIAFINYDSKRGYFIESLSYGLKTLSLKQIDIYRDRILEYISILKQPNFEIRNNDTIEWLIKCAKEPTTMWEGLFELAPNYISVFRFFSDFKGTRYPKGFIKKNSFYSLSSNQKNMLKKYIFDITMVDYSNILFFDIYLDDKDYEILNHLEYLLVNRKFYSESLAFKIMERIFYMNENEDLKKIILERNDIKSNTDYRAQENIIINKFINKLKNS